MHFLLIGHLRKSQTIFLVNGERIESPTSSNAPSDSVQSHVCGETISLIPT